MSLSVLSLVPHAMSLQGLSTWIDSSSLFHFDSFTEKQKFYLAKENVEFATCKYVCLTVNTLTKHK